MGVLGVIITPRGGEGGRVMYGFESIWHTVMNICGYTIDFCLSFSSSFVSSARLLPLWG
jgi:hypothetical protein